MVRRNLVDRARLWLARGLVKGWESAWQSGLLPEWIDYNFVEPTFRRLVYEGYRANSVVFACAESMAFAFTEPKLKVYQRQEGGTAKELPDYPLAKLLRQPMVQSYPTMSGTVLQQATIINTQIGGNGYWHKVRGRSGKVVELVPLNDAHLAPVAGGKTIVDHYDFTPEEGETRDVPVEDVVHFRWLWNPLAPWAGVSPLVAAAKEIDTDNEAARYVFTVLKNDAIPRIALVAPATEDWSDKEKRKRLRESWIESHGGENRGLPAFLWGGMDIKRLSLDLSELAFDALRRLPETRIAAVMRVPPVVAGLLVGLENSGGLNSNAQQAAKWMTERTLVPLWNSFAETITASFDKDFDLSHQGIYVAYDLSTVVSLQEALNEKRTWANQALTGGGITVNEYRSFLNLPRDEDGDVYLRGMATLTEQARFAATGAKRLPAQTETKATRRRAQEQVIAAQRRLRAKFVQKMDKDLDGYFKALADRVIERTGKAWHPRVERKDLPTIEQLFTDTDLDDLAGLVKRYYTELIKATWDTWNVSLGVELAWDLTDPAVTAALAHVGDQIRKIDDTTKEQVRSLLQMGNEGGWSIDQLVRGDPDNDIPGLRDVVEETYKNRAKTIARTELGTAQNVCASGRFEAAGVEDVLVLDNGETDDDEPCKTINGKVKPLAWAKKNPLEHPNCTRAFAPVVPGME